MTDDHLGLKPTFLTTKEAEQNAIFAPETAMTCERACSPDPPISSGISDIQ